LNECRNDIEHLKTDAKETKKSNRKLQLRVQTYEKKLELQQIKEQQMTEMLEKVNEDAERIKLEQETYSKLVSRNSFEVVF
jgi:multidrug resistance efflux pump